MRSNGWQLFTILFSRGGQRSMARVGNSASSLDSSTGSRSGPTTRTTSTRRVALCTYRAVRGPLPELLRDTPHEVCGVPAEGHHRRRFGRGRRSACRLPRSLVLRRSRVAWIYSVSVHPTRPWLATPPRPPPASPTFRHYDYFCSLGANPSGSFAAHVTLMPLIKSLPFWKGERMECKRNDATHEEMVGDISIQAHGRPGRRSEEEE